MPSLLVGKLLGLGPALFMSLFKGLLLLFMQEGFPSFYA